MFLIRGIGVLFFICFASFARAEEPFKGLEPDEGKLLEIAHQLSDAVLEEDVEYISYTWPLKKRSFVLDIGCPQPGIVLGYPKEKVAHRVIVYGIVCVVNRRG